YVITIEDVYKAFDYEPKDFEADVNKLQEFSGFFFSYFESIKPAIKTLEMAEQRYQALFKAARDAIFIMNRDSGIIIDLNLEGEKLVEQPREEILGSEAITLELFDEGLVDPKMVQHLIDQPPPIISRIRKSTGNQMYLEVTVNEIQLANQHYIQYLFHDITDIHVIEDKLKEQVKKIDILNKIISEANQANTLSELLKKLRDNFIELFDLKACSIYLIEKSQKIASIKTHKGFPSYFILENNELDINTKPYEIVYKKGVALINDNFPEFIKSIFWGIEASATAVIPLFSKLEIIGSINMVFEESRTLLPDEMELIITIGLELGTAIERMQNREELHKSEMKNNILFNHIPFSIFRISKNGILLDIKLDKKIEKIVDQPLIPEKFIGKHIDKLLPREITEQAQMKIEQSLQEKKTVGMKFILPINNKQLILQSNIVPLGENEVLVFLQNMSRVW
ncbi:MAG: PAS domain S-box protein, partial [Promethearchaeota archaeon]